MAKDIKVLDQGSHFIGTTYEKRAGQLVKKSRAKWTGHKSIMLVNDEKLNKEVLNMISTTPPYEQDSGYESDFTYPPNSQYKYTIKDKKVKKTGLFKRINPRFGKKTDAYNLNMFLSELDEETLECIIKGRMVDKRKLILHVCTYFIVSAFVMFAGAIIASNYGYYRVMEFLVVLASFWGIFVALHFVTYLTKITPEKVKREMMKVRK